MFEVEVYKATIYTRKREVVTSGSKEAYEVLLEFKDNEWDSLTKTIVFKHRGIVKDIVLNDSMQVIKIPWECMQYADEDLFIGVIGEGNGQMLAFGTDGKVYPCLRYMKHSLTNQPERPIGDIKTGLYTDKEHTEWFQKLKAVTTYSSADSECRTCGLLAICPTCIAWQYDATGDPNKKTKHHCKMFKAQAWANQYYWWRLYKKIDKEAL